MKQRGPRRLALALLLGIGTVLALGPAGAAERVTLLVTHPSAGELRNLAGLVKRGLLQLPGLTVRGIYYAGERQDYEPAREFINREAAEWMELDELSCSISPDQVFTRNGCSRVFERLFEEADGVVFTGGPDIPPRLYGEQTSLTTVIEDPGRHHFELSFLAHLLGAGRARGLRPLLERRPQFLVLGLCLGMQSLNVASGGSLVQDIPSEIYGLKSFEQMGRQPADRLHRSYLAPLYPGDGVGWAVIHPIKFTAAWPPEQPLARRGSRVNVVSLHHQAVERLGAGLEVWATSVDGKVVEAVHHRRWPAVLGVQFHPEKDIIYNAKTVYLARPDADEVNFVASWYAADKSAQAFHRGFWKLVARLLRQSAARRPAER